MELADHQGPLPTVKQEWNGFRRFCYWRKADTATSKAIGLQSK